MNNSKTILITDFESLDVSDDLKNAATENQFSTLSQFLKYDCEDMVELPFMNENLLLEIKNLLLKHDLTHFLHSEL